SSTPCAATSTPGKTSPLGPTSQPANRPRWLEETRSLQASVAIEIPTAVHQAWQLNGGFGSIPNQLPSLRRRPVQAALLQAWSSFSRSSHECFRLCHGQSFHRRADRDVLVL